MFTALLIRLCLALFCLARGGFLLLDGSEDGSALGLGDGSGLGRVYGVALGLCCFVRRVRALDVTGFVGFKVSAVADFVGFNVSAFENCLDSLSTSTISTSFPGYTGSSICTSFPGYIRSNITTSCFGTTGAVNFLLGGGASYITMSCAIGLLAATPKGLGSGARFG